VSNAQRIQQEIIAAGRQGITRPEIAARLFNGQQQKVTKPVWEMIQRKRARVIGHRISPNGALAEVVVACAS
jgi:hypothetical protein